ncbi:MAG: DUF4006 family protein [Epsilonproteobacteria bacterium]|nr:DUF4006 family protein [Campylobacterota bacterium]
MAGNTQIDPKTEGGLFSFLHGLTGFFIFLAIFLGIVFTLTYKGIVIQNENATKFYKVNQDLDGLKFVSPENHNMRTVVGEDK